VAGLALIQDAVSVQEIMGQGPDWNCPFTRGDKSLLFYPGGWGVSYNSAPVNNKLFERSFLGLIPAKWKP
jgi:hypothetical protein